MLALALMLSTSVMAQPRGGKRFNPDKFRTDMEAFISEKAGLTQEDAMKFFPLFHEMKAKQHKLSKQIFELKAKRPAHGTSDKEYVRIISEIKSLNRQMAEVEETYYKRMCKTISARKVYESMLAEDEFHRYTLSKFNRDKHPKPRACNEQPSDCTQDSILWVYAPQYIY